MKQGIFLLLIGLCYLWSTPGWAQSIPALGSRINNTAKEDSIAVRCVKADNSAFESCAGGAGGTTDVNILQILGASPSATNPFPARLTDGTAFYKPTTPSDTQPVSAVSLPLAAGASTEATLALIKTKTDNLDVLLSTRLKPADTLTAVTTVSTVTNLSQMGGAAISMNTCVRDLGTQRVTIATNDIVPVSQSGTWTVQPGNTVNTTAWKVDGSAVTQPVSGTVTASQTTATSLKAEVVGPTADNAANPTAKLSVLAGVANAAAPTRTEGNVVPLRTNLAGDVAVTLDGEAVVLGAGTAEIGKLAAGVAEIGNVKNSGTFAVQAALNAETTKVIGTVNVASGQTIGLSPGTAEIGKLAAGAALIGSVKTDQTTHGTSDLVAADITKIAGSTAIADPCQVNARTYGNINQTTGTQLITGTASKKIYFCSWNDQNGGTAQNYSVVAGTGTVCATTTVAVTGLSGGTTAATGWNVAANGGRTLGNGQSSIAATTVNADNVCLLQSASIQISGGFSYVVQ